MAKNNFKGFSIQPDFLTICDRLQELVPKKKKTGNIKGIIFSSKRINFNLIS